MGAAPNSAWVAPPAGPSRNEERGAATHGPDETAQSVAPVPLFAVPPSTVSSSTPTCLTGRSERTRALAVTAPHKVRLLPQSRKRAFGFRDKQSGGQEGEDVSALQALQHLGHLQRREPELLDKLGPLQAVEKLAAHGVLSGKINAPSGTQNAQARTQLTCCEEPVVATAALQCWGV